MKTSNPTPEDNVVDPEPTTELERSNEPKKRRTHRKSKIFLSVFAGFIGVLVLVAGWLGFVPGLSNLLGANTPKDLGVKYTEADYASFLQKTQTTYPDFTTAPDNPDKPGKKKVFDNPVTVENLVISDSELTAAGANTGWLWMPVKNAQVKFSENTVELSGNLNTEYLAEFINFIGGVGYSQDDVQKGIDYGTKLVGSAPAIYVKAEASVVNDQLTYEVEKVQIGRFSAPLDIASKVLGTGTSNAIVRADNFEAKSVRASDGALVFSGTYPTTIYVKRQ